LEIAEASRFNIIFRISISLVKTECIVLVELMKVYGRIKISQKTILNFTWWNGNI